MSKTPAPIQQNLVAIQDALINTFKEREEVVNCMLAAVLAREPMFLLGPPGTAKSLICEALCKAIHGKYFNIVVNKFTPPEEIFGPLSVTQLKQDKYVRITTDKLPEADIAHIDEGFKASSALLNTFLPVINERTFYNDGVKKIPLQTLFISSNEIPQAEELNAMYDRLVLRVHVQPLKDVDNFRGLLENPVDITKIPSITMAQLAEAQKVVHAMKVTGTAMQDLLKIRAGVQEKGMYVSDRKWVQSMRVVKAAAYLNGHSEVESEDLVILENVLWSEPGQIDEVRAMVRKIANPILEMVRRTMDAAQEIIVQIKDGKINPMEAFKKLQEAKVSMDDANEKDPRPEFLKASKEIGDMCLNLSQKIFNPRATVAISAPPKA